MLRKRALVLLTLLLATLLMAVPAQAAKSFKNVAFVGPYPDRHPTVLQCWNPWIAEAPKGTNGQLTLNYFSPNTLYPEKEAFDAVSDGRTDFGTVRASMFPGTMNLISALDLPGVAPNAVVGSLVAQEVVEMFPEVRAEFPKGAKPYVCWTSAAYQIHTIKPMRNLDEFKGKKIIVWDAIILEMVKMLGANPILMPGTDSYLALSKSMADGIVCPLAPTRSMKITEACKYHFVANLGVGTFNFFVNTKLWDSMPADVQKWLNETGGMAMALGCGKSLEDGQKADIEWMLQQGHTMVYPDDAERARWVKLLTPFKEQWVKDCVNRGIKEEVARKVLKFAEERVAFHTAEMKKGVYGDYKM